MLKGIFNVVNAAYQGIDATFDRQVNRFKLVRRNENVPLEFNPKGIMSEAINGLLFYNDAAYASKEDAKVDQLTKEDIKRFYETVFNQTPSVLYFGKLDSSFPCAEEIRSWIKISPK